MNRRLFPVLFSGGGSTTQTIAQWQTTAFTLKEDFENVSDWVKAEGSDPVEDAVNYHTGTKSVRLANVGGTASAMDKTISPAWNLTGTAKRISIDVYYAGGAAPAFILYLRTGASWSKYLQSTTYELTRAVPGWYTVTLGEADFAMQGGASWTDSVNTVRIRLNGNSSDCSFDSLKIDVQTTAVPAAMFTFDDGFASVHDLALPVFQARRMRATEYIITNFIGNSTYMTAAQIQAMAAAGWLIGNHTHLETGNLTTLTDEQITTQLSTAENVLDGLSLPTGTNGKLHLAYPGGFYNANVAAIMTARGYLTGRTVLPATSWSGFNYYADNPLYYLNGAKQLSNTLTLAAAKSYVDAAYIDGKVATFFGHKITAGAPSTGLEWGVSDLAELLDYVKSKNMPCLTVDDYYRLLSGPVTIPA